MNRPQTTTVAIDPMALALPGHIYAKLKLPNPPPELRAWARQVVQQLDERQRTEVAEHIGFLQDALRAVEGELGTRVPSGQAEIRAR